MGLTRRQRAVVNDIMDDALARYDAGTVGAVGFVVDELEALESQGHVWAADYLAACRWSGLSTRVRQRARAGRAAVAGETVPTCYVTGGVMTSWMHVPVAELGTVVDRLHEQAETLNAHARIVEAGQRLATEHKVETAWLGFEAAGVSVVVAS